VIKVIQYCLDPNKVIFPNYQRFAILEKIKLSDTIVFTIPSFFFQICCICFVLGLLTLAIQNIQFSWNIWSQINNFIQIVVFIIFLLIVCIILFNLKQDGRRIYNFILDTYDALSQIINKTQKVDPNISQKPTKLGVFIQNHLRGIIVFFGILCIFITLNQYHQGIISFIKLSLYLTLFIGFIIIVSLPREWIIKFRGKILAKSTNYSIGKPQSGDTIVNQIDYEIIDAPLQDIKDDQFRRSDFTKQITSLIKNRKDPSSLVIGIYGKWGEGKTSILNFIEHDLKQNSDIICVKYNPWRFNDETQLLRNFFFTLSDKLERSISSSKERIGSYLSKYATILSPISLGIDGVIDISPGEIFSNIGGTFSSVELENLKGRIEKILDDEQKKVVIFIDDIDRLDRQEIQTLLKIVKLTADFRHTVYILSLDEELVASAVGEKYGSGQNDTKKEENGKRFLEKIIQIPLPLPKINDNVLLRMCFKGIERVMSAENLRLSDEELLAFSNLFHLSFFTYLKTPRVIKRYLNRISFSVPLLKNQLNISDLLLIEGIRVFRPLCFSIIQEHPEIFLGSELVTSRNPEVIKQQYKAILDPMFEAEKDDFEKQNLKVMLSTIFPRIRTIYENLSYGPEWDVSWDKEMKICSKRHLERYFSYTVPKGDISENEVKQFINTFNEMTESQISDKIRIFTSDPQTADLFLFELRKNINEIQPNKIQDFILALSNNASYFPTIDIGLKLSPESQLAAFLRDLIISIPEDSKRILILKTICSQSQPLSFGYIILALLKQKIDAEPNKSPISEGDYIDFGRVLVERTKITTLDDILTNNDAPLIFSSWLKFGSKNDIESFLSNAFNTNLKNVIPFLKFYLSKSWNSQGLPIRGDLRRDAYNMIIRFCDPAIVYTALEKIYGDLSKADYREDTEIEEDLQIANQFSYLYHHKESPTPESES
jgi:predicted KAP-like P-loop ATPase